jgi:uncharacterized protein YneR
MFINRHFAIQLLTASIISILAVACDPQSQGPQQESEITLYPQFRTYKTIWKTGVKVDSLQIEPKDIQAFSLVDSISKIVILKNKSFWFYDSRILLFVFEESEDSVVFSYKGQVDSSFTMIDSSHENHSFVIAGSKTNISFDCIIANVYQNDIQLYRYRISPLSSFKLDSIVNSFDSIETLHRFHTFSEMQ